MNTRRAVPADRDVLFDIWLRSVRATHDFVSPEDIQSIIPLVKDYLASGEPEFWVVSSDHGAVMGFMGLSGSKMEALFLAPEFRGRGAGRQRVHTLGLFALSSRPTSMSRTTRPGDSTRAAGS